MTTTASLGELGIEHRAGFWGKEPGSADVDVRVVRNGDIRPTSATSLGTCPVRGFSGREAQEAKLEPGDVLVTTSGEPGKCAYWEETSGGYAVSNFVRRLRAPNSTLGKLVYYALRTQEARELFARHSRGVAIKNLSAEFWEQFRVPIFGTHTTELLVEAIESHLTRLDAATACLDRVKARLKTYRASILNAAVEGRLVPTEAALARKEKREYEPASVLLDRILRDRRHRWEEAELARLKKAGKAPKDERWKAAYEAPPAPDASKLPQLPEGWCWTSLGQAFNVTVGATPSRGNTAYWNGDIPWVSSGEVAFCRITDTAEKITHLGFENSSTKMNPKGSVLLGMIGEGKTRGQVAILDVDACGNQNAAAIWVSHTAIPPEYVYYYLLGQYEVTRRRGSGNNQPALNKGRVESIPLPLAPLAEAQRIVERLDADTTVISDIEASAQRGLSRVSRVRQAILKWAFEGKLVDQDPADEPAEKLLARIRAERATTTKNPKNSKERLAG